MEAPIPRPGAARGAAPHVDGCRRLSCWHPSRWRPSPRGAKFDFPLPARTGVQKHGVGDWQTVGFFALVSGRKQCSRAAPLSVCSSVSGVLADFACRFRRQDGGERTHAARGKASSDATLGIFSPRSTSSRFRLHSNESEKGYCNAIPRSRSAGIHMCGRVRAGCTLVSGPQWRRAYIKDKALSDTPPPRRMRASPHAPSGGTQLERWRYRIAGDAGV